MSALERAALRWRHRDDAAADAGQTVARAGVDQAVRALTDTLRVNPDYWAGPMVGAGIVGQQVPRHAEPDADPAEAERWLRAMRGEGYDG